METSCSAAATDAETQLFLHTRTWINDHYYDDKPLSPDKHSKKVRLKQTRAYMCLLRAEHRESLSGLLSSPSFPTHTVYIHGCGGSCGERYEHLQQLFSHYGVIEHLLWIGSCPFILITYTHLQSAIQCKQDCHAKMHSGLRRLLFVEYINRSSSELLQTGGDSHELMLPNAQPLEETAAASVVPLPSLLSPYSSLLLPLSSSRVSSCYPGLLLVNDFVSVCEETALLSFFESQSWHDYKFRSVQHYGYNFDYELNDIDRQQPQYWKHTEKRENEHVTSTPTKRLQMFPLLFHSIIQRMNLIPQLIAAQSSMNSEATFCPDQCTVNKYVAGAGIPAHVDVHSAFTDVITSLSLNADIVMEILTPSSSDDLSPPSSSSSILPITDEFPLLLPRRSLLILADYARYGLYHSIQPRKTDRVNQQIRHRHTRVSMTFRELRLDGENCHCPYTHLCDSALGWRKKDKKFTGKKEENTDKH